MKCLYIRRAGALCRYEAILEFLPAQVVGTFKGVCRKQADFTARTKLYIPWVLWIPWYRMQPSKREVGREWMAKEAECFFLHNFALIDRPGYPFITLPSRTFMYEKCDFFWIRVFKIQSWIRIHEEKTRTQILYIEFLKKGKNVDKKKKKNMSDP